MSGELSSKLQNAVSNVLDNEQWRLEYMLQEVRDQLNVDKGRKIGFQEGHDRGLEEGHEAGLREGHSRGLAEGEAKFATLATRLIQDGRAEDVAKAASNTTLRQQLYERYGLDE